MITRSHTPFSLFVVVGLALVGDTGSAAAQESGDQEGQQAEATFVVDEALAKQGKSAFRQRGCNACHTIGKGRGAGPDLLAVTDRREHAWLARFLKDPGPMLDSDPIAQEMLKEFRNARMPNLRLSDAEIQALIHYFAQETAAQKDG